MNPPAPVPDPSGNVPAYSGVEWRALSDRRREPTGPWAAMPPAGRRMQNRRAADRRQIYFVDRFTPAVLGVVLLLVIASLADAVLTIHLLNAGGKEINPLMGRLLQYGSLPFLLVKYALTVGGLPLLLIFKNYYFFGTRLRVGHLIPLALLAYAFLLGYQLVLCTYVQYPA